MRERGILWEMKLSGNTQITIKAVDWEKVRKNALMEDRIPAIHIEMGGSGMSKRRHRLVLIDEGDFEMLFPADGAS